MAQYQAGLINVENGSQVVTGDGTAFLANTRAGDLFRALGAAVHYTVGEVLDDSQLKLTGNFLQDSLTGAPYTISRDFTPLMSLPELFHGDYDVLAYLTEALRRIDTYVGTYGLLGAESPIPVPPDAVNDYMLVTSGGVYSWVPKAAETLTTAERLAASGIWYGTQAELDSLSPDLKKTAAEWLASGTGYFEFHVFAQAVSAEGVFIVAGVAAALNLSANVPTILGQYLLAGASAPLSLSAGAPTVIVVSVGVITVVAVAADMALSANAPNALINRLVDGPTAEMALSGGVSAVTIVSVGVISTEAETASIALFANTPSVLAHRLTVGETIDMALSSGAPVVTIVPAAVVTVAAVAADLAVTAGTPGAQRTLLVTGSTADIALGAGNPTVARTLLAFGETANMQLFSGIPSVLRLLGVAGSTANMPLIAAVPTVAVVASAPAQVTGLTVVNTTPQLKADWPAVSGATTYDLYYRYGAAPTTSVYDGVITGITEAQRVAGYVINGPLTAGTEGNVSTYTSVCVRAVNAGVPGLLSAAAAAAAAAAALVVTTLNSFSPVSSFPLRVEYAGDEWDLVTSTSRTLDLKAGLITCEMTWNNDEGDDGIEAFSHLVIDGVVVQTHVLTASCSYNNTTYTGMHTVRFDAGTYCEYGGNSGQTDITAISIPVNSL